MQENNETKTELADLTAILFFNLAYWLVICWIIPVVPMFFMLLLNYSFSLFLSFWIGGLPFCALFLFYIHKQRFNQPS
jgi:hypothetical protein